MDVIHAGAPARPGSQSGYRWVILVVAVVAQLGSAVPSQSVPVFGYFMQLDLGLTRAQYGLLATALAVGQVLVLSSAGVVTDRVGIRRMFLVGLVVIGSFMVGVGLGDSFPLALITLLFVGVGGALCNPATSKVIMYWFAPKIRATAMSIKQTGVPMGGMITAAIMPTLAIAYGWRATVVAMGLAIVGMGILVFLFYREYPGPVATERGSRQGSLGETWQLLRRRDVLTVSLMAMPMSATQLALVTYIILYLKEDFFYSVVLGGLTLSLIQLSGVGGRIVWGLASDYLFHGDRPATLLALVALGVLVMLVLAALPPGVPFWLVAAIAIAAGGSSVSWNGVWMTQVGELAGKELAGSVTGISMTLGQMGIVFGPPLFGYVVDSTGSYRLGWLLLAGFSAASWLLVLSLRWQRKRSPAGPE